MAPLAGSAPAARRKGGLSTSPPPRKSSRPELTPRRRAPTAYTRNRSVADGDRGGTVAGSVLRRTNAMIKRRSNFVPSVIALIMGSLKCAVFLGSCIPSQIISWRRHFKSISPNPYHFRRIWHEKYQASWDDMHDGNGDGPGISAFGGAKKIIANSSMFESGFLSRCARTSRFQF
ncbi:hypothetical protein B0H17DRAFT_1143779 [Mycena rosella]|uniref:Uncharacterized protein n=1 Tax=Mycena rosella TaxID=1033263 RepID=A0AAD7CUW2_MYCRO|nr:hypothetical protein B0H17DRAFT_1143779 [Mycena rosella]